MSKDTLFTNDTGAAGGAVDYVKDVFQDVSLPPTVNTGLTDTAATNPLGVAFANDDSVKYGVKTLYIKDLVLLADKSKWVSNKPTYQIIWNESFPQVTGYLFGNYSINEPLANTSYTIKTIGDGIGITGVVRRAQFIVTDNTAATATAQVVVDGVNGNTVDFSSLSSDSDATLFTRLTPFVHAAANVSNDIHDFRLTALQSNTLRIVGVVVYFENAGANIDVNLGVTYVNKTKVSSLSGATFAVPTPGSSLGAKSLIYKTSSAGYAISTQSCGTVTSQATGTAGTNLLSVSTGHGASFQVGGGLVVGQGTSQYIGNILNVSTDTLTMGATLPFAIAAPVYRAWQAGGSFAQNASLMQLAYSIDFSKYSNLNGASLPILDPIGRYSFWGNGIGVSLVDSIPALYMGAAGFFQVDGYFSGAEIEMIGNGIFHATLSVNGVVGYNINVGQTGALKRNVFTEAGPGWNSFNVGFGSSMGVLGINKINLYQRSRDMGVSFGILAELETSQAYVNRGTISATQMALGLGRRIYSDQMYLKGSWVRGSSTGAAGGAYYSGASTTSVFRQEYYGKDFAIIGTAPGGSLLLDGNTVPMTFNAMQSVATEGFHTVQFTVATGTTAIVQAFDYVRSHGEIKNLQTVSGATTVLSVKPYSMVRVCTSNARGSTATCIRRYTTILANLGQAITYSDSATNGAAFLINEPGVYAISTYENIDNNTGNGAAGISLNSVNLTSDITNVPNPERLAMNHINTGGLTYNAACSWTGVLFPGDIIRPHQNTSDPTTAANAQFCITKVSQ